jgi:hypothetical protein
MLNAPDRRQRKTKFWHQTGNLDAAQAEQKEMKRPLFTRDADATASLWRDMDLRQPGGQQSSCATRDPDPCPQIVRPYAKASEPRMERK